MRGVRRPKFLNIAQRRATQLLPQVVVIWVKTRPSPSFKNSGLEQLLLQDSVEIYVVENLLVNDAVVCQIFRLEPMGNFGICFVD